MNTQDLRIVRRMAELMPLKDAIKKEKTQINKVDFSKVTTFITPKPISREIAFYYLLHNNIIDFVKVLTAEAIKDIYMNNHPTYKSFHDLSYPIVVVLLGMELYNRQMITILNIFEDMFLSEPNSKALIFVYEGTVQDFRNKYKNTQERGILNTGKTVSLTQATSKSSSSFEL